MLASPEGYPSSDSRQPIVEALSRLTPPDDHAFFYGVIEHSLQNPSSPTVRSKFLQEHAKSAIKALDGRQPSDYAELIKVVESKDYPNWDLPLAAIDQLESTVVKSPRTDSGMYDPNRIYATPELLRQTYVALKRAVDESPRTEVALFAARSLHNFYPGDTYGDDPDWVTEIRGLANGARHSSVRAWACKELEWLDR